MFRNRKTILLFAFVVFTSTAWSQGRGQGAAASAGASERGAAATREVPSPQTPPAQPASPASAASKNGDVIKGAPNKVSSEIAENPALTLKVQPMLPPGTTLDAASNGFKNPGQFVAALHVSENLGLSFDRLKEKIVTDKQSLGDAIHALKPTASKDQVNAEVKKAESQAKDDMKKS